VNTDLDESRSRRRMGVVCLHPVSTPTTEDIVYSSGSIGTVRITRVRFLEDDVYEGGIPQASYDNAVEDEYQCDTVDDAVRHIREHGLTFSATGADWAAHPDGSQIIDYGTAEREEVTAHLSLFSAFHEAAIIEAVG
jgi:hypothetical protein